MKLDDLKARLGKAAETASNIQRQMAEAKSLRQEGNVGRRTDLYMWPTPEQTLEGQALTAISDLEALVGELEAAVVILRREATLLLSNSEGCARNHYGDDCQTFGIPQWLIDSRRNIEQAFYAAENATLAKLEKARGKDQEHG